MRLHIFSHLCANVQRVVKNGFNRSYSTTAAYGKGVYFARDSSYSVSGYCPTDPKRGHLSSIILARVLVGRATVGRGSMVAPPPLESHDQAAVPVPHDALVDMLEDPSIFVSCRESISQFNVT